MISFTHDCGEQYNLPDDSQGKTYRCRKCSQAFTVASTPGGGRVGRAAGKSWDAFKLLMSDPMTQLPQMARTLDEAGCMEVGLVFCAAFAAACCLTGYQAMGSFNLSGLHSSVSQKTGYVQLFIAGVIPPAALALGFFVVGKIFHGKASLQKSIFGAGTTLLPSIPVLLLMRVLPAANWEILVAAGLFAVCFSILILYAASVGLHEISARNAFIMVPILVLVSAYITKILWVQLIAG